MTGVVGALTLSPPGEDVLPEASHDGVAELVGDDELAPRLRAALGAVADWFVETSTRWRT